MLISLRERGQKGFTLIELMVVIAIIAGLVALAVPSYQEYIVRSNRTDLQSHLLRLASDLERYKSQQMSYRGVTLAMINGGVATYPISGAARYNLVLNLLPSAATATGWTLVATPAAGSTQVGDGALSIDNQGRRCWNGASDAGCNLADPAQAWSSKAN